MRGAAGAWATASRHAGAVESLPTKRGSWLVANTAIGVGEGVGPPASIPHPEHRAPAEGRTYVRPVR